MSSEYSAAITEDFVADIKCCYVVANCFNITGEFISENGVFWSYKAAENPDEKRLCPQETAICSVDRCRVNLYQHFIFFWNRFPDVCKVKNVW